MNGDDSSWTDADRLTNLVRSLEHQRGPDDGSRGELLASLHRIVRGTAVPADRAVDAIVDLMSDSSLGDRTLDERDDAELSDPPDPSEVAAVLDRLDEAEKPVPSGVVADDPVLAWSREFGRLVGRHSAAELAELLDAQGLDEDRRSALAQPSCLAQGDPENERLARAVVETLGEDWTGSGFGELFAAARRTCVPHPPWTLRISGLAGADMPDGDAVRARLEGPIDALPVVRGREKVVTRVVANVRNRRGPGVQVLVGAAGLGKTTVALAVARRVRGRRMLPLCVPAETLDELVDGLHLAAVCLGVALERIEAARRGGPARQARMLWELLDDSTGPWLIVLDGAGPDAIGDPAWTRGSAAGAVLVTTRFGDGAAWGAGCRLVEIGPVPTQAGGQIVLDRIGPEPELVARAAREHARVLSLRLDGVPLALSSAGRLAAASPSGARALEHMAHVLDALHAPSPVSAVYELGVRSGSDPELRELVRLLACFAPNQPLPVDVLAPAADIDGAPNGLLPRLVGTGLVEERRRGGGHTITIHPALADQSRQDEAFRTGAALVDRRAIGLLQRRLNGLDTGVLSDRPLLWLLEPHVAELLDSPAIDRGELLVEVLNLAERTAAAFVRCGDQVAACALLTDASSRAAALDRAHPTVLALRHTRARMAALDGGDFVTAERELADVLALRSRVLGEQHPQTLSTRDCLAWVTAERGVPEGAREEMAAVLAARTDVLGPDDPHTLATRHRLAWVDAQLGRPDEAARELVEVLRMRRQRLGLAHLDVYSTRYRLAWALVKANRLAEAEETYRELQDDLEAAAGWRHPLTLMVRVRVGWVLVRQGRADEADEYLRDVLDDQESVLGDGHRRVLRTRHLLAYVALQRGSVAEAVSGFEDVIARRTALLGADHPDTLDSRSQLAWAWLHSGSARTADRWFQAVAADRRRVLGPSNLDTLKSRCLVARSRMLRGRLAEAQALLRRLQEDAEAALPPGHPLVFDVRHTLAVVNGLRGRSATAEQGLRALLDDRSRYLGAEHAETLATRDYLAWVLGRQGAIGEARDVAEAVLADRIRLLGERHLHTLTSRYRVAWLTERDGRWTDAMEQFERLLQDLVAVLGADHPDTLRCRHGLVRLRRLGAERTGVAAGALSLLRDQIRVQGVDAVDTLRAGEEVGLVLREVPGHEQAAATVLAEVLRRRRAEFDEDHPDTVRLLDVLRHG